MTKGKRTPKVAVLVEMSRAHGRGMLEGISQYSHRHGPWAIYHHERTLRDGVPAWLGSWDGDGIIARVETRSAIQKIRRMGLPTVDLFSWYSPPGVPTVKVDEWNVARMAAEHLLERGFRQFAYCGFAGADFSEQRCQCFVRYLAEQGYDVNVYGGHRRRPGRVTSMEVSGLARGGEVGTWLRALPKPIGLMACNDICGQQILNACMENGISVPDEVAVIGVDNDVLVCQMALPSLSSVELDGVGAGYAAAEMLDQLMHRRRRSRDRLFKPLTVVARQSTDAVATADKDVVTAAQFIRHHAVRGIGVKEVIETVSLSRSTLERRFADTFGHSIRAEIDRVKLNRVRELLTRTDWTLRQIAADAGFAHLEPLCRLFKRKTGLTPGQFRKRSLGKSR
jgi:LacI family transcriptional regulator